METSGPELHSQMSEILKTQMELAKRVKFLLYTWVITVVVMVLSFWIQPGSKVHADSANEILKTRSLVIVDEHGTPRVKIGAPLPEPIIMGKQQKRDDSIAGILIYDAHGNERGGYVTDNSVGNALLSLDSNIGQEVTLVAYAGGGAEFGISDDHKNKVVMQAVENGPRFRLLHRGKIVTDLPTSAR